MILADRCTILHKFRNRERRMDLMTHQQVERAAHKAQANTEELVELIARAVREDGTAEPLKGLFFQRSSSPREPLHGVSDPAFCVIAQGSKQVFLGNERYQYDPAHYLLTTAELPLVGHIL